MQTKKWVDINKLNDPKGPNKYYLYYDAAWGEALRHTAQQQLQLR